MAELKMKCRIMAGLTAGATLVVPGCMTEPYPGHGYERGSSSSGTAYEDEAPSVYIQGCWSFPDPKTGQTRVNFIEEIDEYTILVTPVNPPGSVVQFDLQSENVYQLSGEKNRTYQFAPGVAVYRNHDTGLTIRLRYTSSSC